jgi:hypothetical protein
MGQYGVAGRTDELSAIGTERNSGMNTSDLTNGAFRRCATGGAAICSAMIVLACCAVPGWAQTSGQPEFGKPCNLKDRPLTLIGQTKVDYGPDGAMILKEVGILARDRDGNIWETRRTTAEASSPIAFFLKTRASKTETPTVGSTDGEPTVDISKRYIWKSKATLTMPPGGGFGVKDVKNGQVVSGLDEEKTSIPCILEGNAMRTFVDLPGVKNVHVQIDPDQGKTIYAGLVFTAPCVVGILKDGTVYAQRSGVSVRDQDGHAWISRAATIEGAKTCVFLIDTSPKPAVPAAKPKEVAPAPRPKEAVPAAKPKEAVPAVKPKSPTSLPPFKEALRGTNPVRVRNPNSFAVSTGLRMGDKGKDFSVPPNGVNTVYVPNGMYDVYFVYSDKPDALFQGDSFTLIGEGVEIQIVKVVNGNYGIRQVK